MGDNSPGTDSFHHILFLLFVSSDPFVLFLDGTDFVVVVEESCPDVFLGLQGSSLHSVASFGSQSKPIA